MTPHNSPSRVIPPGAWAIAAALFLLPALGLAFFLFGGFRRVHLPEALLLLAPLLLAAYALAVGYVYGDARRRGMRYVMWTLLAIFVPNGIGIILYFILREPMPVYCSRCGAPMQPGFAFCPGCGANYLPACGACGKTLQPGWTHCAWCGMKTR